MHEEFYDPSIVFVSLVLGVLIILVGRFVEKRYMCSVCGSFARTHRIEEPCGLGDEKIEDVVKVCTNPCCGQEQLLIRNLAQPTT